MSRSRLLTRIAIGLATSLIVLGFCLWLWFLRGPATVDPLGNEPGETWVKGRGYSHAVRLMESGRYAMQIQCDICDEPLQSGTWTRRGQTFVLRHASGSIAMELVPVTVMGCEALARRGEQNARAPGSVYFKQDDRCSDAL